MGRTLRALLGGTEERGAFALVACVTNGAPPAGAEKGPRWIASRDFGPSDLQSLPADTVVLDVSLAAGTETLVAALEAASPRAAVIATTGLSAPLEERIAALGRRAAVLRAKNLSLGIAVARRWLALLPAAARAAYVADIVEQHHAGKKDAPSGTAIELRETLGSVGGARRPDGAVSTHSIRAGTVPGTHRVILSGEGETLEIVHAVQDRSVFARGALRAARFLHGRAPGTYSVDDLIHDSWTP
jgi:4-hydroxy-tetrahydrodipicolinate reductase